MNKVLPILYLMLIGFSAIGQTGNIRGKVNAADHTPLSEASIKVIGSTKGTVSDTYGAFQISNIATGNYTLRISRIGYISKTVSINVESSETTEVPTVTLIESSSNNLNEVVVNGSSPNQFGRELSTTVSKMPLKDVENPQVYNSISNVLLKEQVVTNFDDALKNAPGIDKLWESTGRGGDGAGYFSLRGFAVQPTMINGLPALTNGSPDIANVESIEVIKGPSGTLYGSSLISYGGLINVNTKRPFYGFGGNISYTAGSYGLNRVSADVNTMLSKGKKIAMRLNTAYSTQNSYQDAGFKKSLFVAPSLSYDVNDRLSFFVNTEFYQGKSTNQTMLFVDRGSPLRVHNMDELGYDIKRSYTGNDLYMNTPTFSMQSQMNYKLSDKWTSQTVFSSSSAKSDGYYSYLYEVTTTAETLAQTPINDGIILARYTSKQNSETIGTDIQQNFNGDFNIGKIRNRVLVGLDYFNRKAIGNSTGYGVQGFVNIGVDNAIFQALVPALHTTYKIPKSARPDDSGVLTQAGADEGILALANPNANYSIAKQEIYSAYVSDVINFTPALSAMASLRVDRFDNGTYDQTALSPKFGLVFQPVLNKVSLFGNYMNGFKNVAPVTLAANGQVLNFDPEHANQFEFGTKLNLLADRLSATLSYYDIKVSNTVLQLSPTEYTQGGEQYSKGFEASLLASPVQGLNLIVGYSYNDSKLTKGNGSAFEGYRPESAGPKNLANLWLSYKFSNLALNGFGLGFGGNYASENMIYNRSNGTFTLPSYTIFNASVFYDAKDFRLGLKLDNIANKAYYKGWSTISPQGLRTLSANFTYNF